MKINYKACLLMALIALMSKDINAQGQSSKNEKDDEYEQAYLGFGAGLDYGGLGIKAEFLPAKWLGVFAGGGYNLVDPAYNVGISLKILPGKNVTPIVMLMYGYNAAIKIKGGLYGNADIHRKSYYGVSTGAGVDVKAGRYNNNKVSLALLIPFRSTAFHDDYDGFEDAGYEFNPKIIPIAFSVGYCFSVGKKMRKN